MLQIDRAEAQIEDLINGDLQSYFYGHTIVGLPAPHEMLRERFKSKASWRVFLYKTRKRWFEFIKEAELSRGDTVFFANSLRETLNAPLVDKK